MSCSLDSEASVPRHPLNLWELENCSGPVESCKLSTVSCSHRDESAVTRSPVIVEQTVAVLQANGIVPAGDRESEETLDERAVKGPEYVFLGPIAVKLRQV